MKNVLIVVMILGLLTSCSNYYKAALATNPPTASSMKDLQSKNKFFILRYGNGVFAMKDISFSADGKSISCRLDSLKFDHLLHLSLGRHGKMRYRKSGNEDESEVLNEVHIYTNPNETIAAGPYSLAFDQVQKIEVIEADTKRTNTSHVIGFSIGAVGAAAAIVGLVTLVGSSFTIF